MRLISRLTLRSQIIRRTESMVLYCALLTLIPVLALLAWTIIPPPMYMPTWHFGTAGIASPLAHAPYTLNACAKEERTRAFALETLADDER